MGRRHEAIDDRLADWIREQHVFFVATAPLGAEGHVNLSTKGFDGSFAVLGPHEVAYLDYTGSGVETVAHLRENGRICIMFCAFGGPPKVVRLHGRGDPLEPGRPGFDDLLARFDRPIRRGLRAIIRVNVDRVSSSCGFGVPFMDFRAERDTMDKWMAPKSDDDLDEYRREKNAESIDGLPGVKP
jgi:hypothetical protein